MYSLPLKSVGMHAGEPGPHRKLPQQKCICITCDGALVCCSMLMQPPGWTDGRICFRRRGQEPILFPLFDRRRHLVLFRKRLRNRDESPWAEPLDGLHSLSPTHISMICMQSIHMDTSPQEKRGAGRGWRAGGAPGEEQTEVDLAAFSRCRLSSRVCVRRRETSTQLDGQIESPAHPQLSPPHRASCCICMHTALLVESQFWLAARSAGRNPQSPPRLFGGSLPLFSFFFSSLFAISLSLSLTYVSTYLCPVACVD